MDGPEDFLFVHSTGRSQLNHTAVRTQVGNIVHIQPNVQITIGIGRQIHGTKCLVVHGISIGTAGNLGPIGTGCMATDSVIFAQHSAVRSDHVDDTVRYLRLANTVKVGSAYCADTCPVIGNIGIVTQGDSNGVLTGLTQVEDMMGVHVTGTQVCPVDGFLYGSVYADLQIAAVGIQFEEHIEVGSVDLEGDGRTNGAGLPAFCAQLIDPGGIVAGPAVQGHLDLIGSSKVFNQDRVSEAILGDAGRQRGIQSSGCHSCIHDVGLQIGDQQIGQ